MKATGSKAAVLTNIFGGASNNEGLGLFTFSFDWQYVRFSLPHENDTEIDRLRSLPSKPLFLSLFKFTKLPALLFALLSCLAFTTETVGTRGRSHSCQQSSS